MPGFKRGLLRTLVTVGGTRAVRPLARGRGTIFMLHRFREAGGRPGHDVATLRGVLGYLRGRRWPLLSVEELLGRLEREEPVSRAIAFTIDDGYEDHASVAAPLFAEFDCPVTTFVASGFLDGQLWFWWDRIEHVFRRTKLPRFTVELPGERFTCVLADAAARGEAKERFTGLCKHLAEAEKLSAIERLSGAADVEIPAAPPPEYAPMTWDQLRACERSGMSFGPHTVTHPILARTDDPTSAWEIEQSWMRLREEAGRPVPVFCYPNGQDGDFGARETATLARLGFLGAVVGTEGHATMRAFHAGDGRYRVPRYTECEDLTRVVYYASGLVRVRQMLRGRVA
jgi:peptidoglycan/xylan/chitin deacetylase (PgdA/CDA1 family)